MRTEESDRYFALKARAKKLAQNSHSIAYSLNRCMWCSGVGVVTAVDCKLVDGRATRVIRSPLEHLPCVCTVGWPYYKSGEGYDGP